MAKLYGLLSGVELMFRRSRIETVNRLLSRRGRTLAIAESLTSGHLQTLIGSRSGASNFFKGGVTAYTIPVKAQLLEIDIATAETCDAVCADTAKQMASGVCRLFAADYGIATTGYAEPSSNKSVLTPHAYVAIYSAVSGDTAFCERFRGGGLNRVRMQRATAEYALRALADVLALAEA